MSNYPHGMAPPLADPRPLLTVSFGSRSSEPGNAIEVGLPILAGDQVEALFPHARPVPARSGFRLFEQDHWTLGHCATGVTPDIETATFRTYQALLKATEGRQLCRIWNYVPRINEISSSGLEVYRAFSLGRASAFEAHFGAEFEKRLPAASAVGSDGAELVVAFAASTLAATHFENPQQVPAYNYPPEHGPRAPSFARATVVSRDDGRRDTFVSGTSAIRGHETVAPGDTMRQLTCTLENLREISRVCDLGEDLAAGASLARHLKVYLRHAHDLADVSRALAGEFVSGADHVTFLRSDICRAALNIEIEASIFGSKR